MQFFADLIARNKRESQQAIFAVCSAHKWVIEACMQNAMQKDEYLLIEATANQVNQFGGYTGMTAAQFRHYVEEIADGCGFPHSRLLLGGDHLGPVCWKSESAALAMQKAQALVASYAAAGFKKIHLDASMPCADDPVPLPESLIAERAASLCAVAEQAAIATFGYADIVYVIGTEVPAPGGVEELETTLAVTPVNDAAHTIQLHRNAFHEAGLNSDVWERVIALVVQPGMEFDHHRVHRFVADKITELGTFIQSQPHLAYEAHSTDYSPLGALRDLVRQHFAILKVGPELTFALREALYALSYIEELLVPVAAQSHLRDVCEQRMLANPHYWQSFYAGKDNEKLLRHFSYSDRIRYYWNDEQVSAAVNKLLSNLNEHSIPSFLLKQFFPHYQCDHSEHPKPLTAKNLVLAHIQQVADKYSRACQPLSHV